MTDYRAHPAANFSHIKQLDTSALHYKANVINCSQDILDKGTAVHAGALEGAVAFGDRFTFFPGKTRRGKEWEAFQEDNKAKTILSKKDFEDAMFMIGAINDHPVASGLIKRLVEVEAERYWTNTETGLECKAKIDGILDDGAVVELKTARSSTPDDFARQVAAMKYHAQAAMYCDGAGTRDHYFIVVQNSAPWDVVCFKSDPDMLDEGLAVYTTWLKRLKEVKASGEFPGVAPDKILTLDLPGWAYKVRGVDTDDDVQGGYAAPTTTDN